MCIVFFLFLFSCSSVAFINRHHSERYDHRHAKCVLKLDVIEKLSFEYTTIFSWIASTTRTHKLVRSSFKIFSSSLFQKRKRAKKKKMLSSWGRLKFSFCLLKWRWKKKRRKNKCSTDIPNMIADCTLMHDRKYNHKLILVECILFSSFCAVQSRCECECVSVLFWVPYSVRMVKDEKQPR